jgi:glycosyltransferase involved in cell wall biosynthesis
MSSILTISEIFWPEGGGAERATYLILSLLAQQGFKITVITGTSKPAMIPGVKYYFTRYLRNSNRLTGWTLVRLLATQHTFTKLLEEHDILYIPLSAYPLIPIAKKIGLHVIVHFHNYMPIRYGGVKYFFEPDIISPLEELRLAVFHEFYIQKSSLRTLLSPLSLIGYMLSKGWLMSVDRIICVSKRQAELISKNYPQLADKIEVIYNPFPTEFMSIETEKNVNSIPTFLYVGGDNYIKGFHVLLYILKKLKNENMISRFLLLGNYSKHSTELLRKIGQGKTLKLDIIGFVPHERVIELHKVSWALLFLSLIEEPLPYAVIEASMLNTLPIAPKMGGIKEILYDTPAEKYMFTPWNVKDIVEKVKTIATNDINNLMKEGSELRAAMFKFFRESHDKSLKKLIKVFSYK